MQAISTCAERRHRVELARKIAIEPIGRRGEHEEYERHRKEKARERAIAVEHRTRPQDQSAEHRAHGHTEKRQCGRNNGSRTFRPALRV